MKRQSKVKRDDRCFHGRPKRDRKALKAIKRELARPRR